MKTARILKLAAGTVLVGGGLTLSLASAAPEAPAAGQQAERPVAVAPARPAGSAGSLELSGLLRSSRRAELAFTVDGRLAERPVAVGDRVAAGALLARLDGVEQANAAEAADAAVAEIEARRAQAERDRQRLERLLAVKAATREELEQAEAAADALAAARESAAARRREAHRRLAEGTLAAPYAGTVTAVRAEPGEYLPAGRPVVVLSGDGALEVEVGAPESLLPHLAAGQEVTVTLPLAGARARGRVQSVGRAAVGAGHLFPVVVALEEAAGLAPGMTAQVGFDKPAPDGLTVPLAAVLNPGGRAPALFLLRDGRARRVEVTVAALTGVEVVVQGPLTAGDRVIVAGHTGLADGDPVVDGMEVLP